MKSLNAVLLTAVLGLGLSLAASAHEVVYTAPLLGSSEVPLAATPGTGAVRVTLDLDLITMRVEVTFADLLGTTAAAHIHCCIAPGGNAGVATQLPSFVAFPLGVHAGSYDHTFDMSLASSYNSSFVSSNGGTVGAAFNAFIAGLDAGKAYFNLHTSAFPGGEVRGLLQPVPLPGAIVLLLPALGVLGGRARRRS